MRAAGLRKGRRYGITAAMVERATERRLAGDWRGACEAAGVEVEIDLDALRGEHGSEFAGRLLDDLAHLVPDLARLHMPRFWNGSGALIPKQYVLLSRPGGEEGPWLKLRPRSWKIHGEQRLVLIVDKALTNPYMRRSNRTPRLWHWSDGSHLWSASRHLWDSRHTHEARERWGGSAERAPFLNPDGTPRTVDELPTADPGAGDPAARTEWIDTLHQTDRVKEAFAAAGIELDPAPAELEWGEPSEPEEAVAELPFSPARLADEARRLVEAGFGRQYQIPFTIHEILLLDLEGDVPRLRFEELYPRYEEELPMLPEVCWIRPPDIDVLRDGVSPEELHPLVREALAPARPSADGAVRLRGSVAFGPVRVRCTGGEWHTVTPTAEGLDIPHTADELERETALRALGGESTGCFAARHAWNTGEGRLPRALRVPRDDLFERVRHGDTDAVLAYLDAGGDPNLHDRNGRTLLHHLAMVDHEEVLPRLLKAGADVDARDPQNHTPLGRAVMGSGTVELARALLDAGASTDEIADEGHEGYRFDLKEAANRRFYDDSEEALPVDQEWKSLTETG